MLWSSEVLKRGLWWLGDESYARWQLMSALRHHTSLMPSIKLRNFQSYGINTLWNCDLTVTLYKYNIIYTNGSTLELSVEIIARDARLAHEHYVSPILWWTRASVIIETVGLFNLPRITHSCTGQPLSPIQLILLHSTGAGFQPTILLV
jgi:hypothetical protein